MLMTVCGGKAGICSQYPPRRRIVEELTFGGIVATEGRQHGKGPETAGVSEIQLPATGQTYEAFCSLCAAVLVRPEVGVACSSILGEHRTVKVDAAIVKGGGG